MRINDLINEAGIRTADIDVAARLALRDILPETMRVAIKAASIGLPQRVINNSSELHDRIYNYFLMNKNSLINYICDAMSIAFTDVAKNRLMSLPIELRHIARTIRVFVEDRERSSDQYKKSGGYYSQERNLFKIFVNGTDLSNAAFELIQNEIFGDAENTSYEKLISVVIPIFVHEYAHLEQNLRKKVTPTADLGYITTGIRGRARRGKRGGFIRNQEKTLDSYLRYKSNVDEIDSFASQAAAEAMHEFFKEYGFDNPNYKIKLIQQDMAKGYSSDSKTFTHYGELLKNAFAGKYEEIGLNPKQMEKVWKRFAKRVYQKLEDYKVSS